MVNFQNTFKNIFPDVYNINYEQDNIFSLDLYENKSNFYYYIKYKIGKKDLRLSFYIGLP